MLPSACRCLQGGSKKKEVPLCTSDEDLAPFGLRVGAQRSQRLARPGLGPAGATTWLGPAGPLALTAAPAAFSRR